MQGRVDGFGGAARGTYASRRKGRAVTPSHALDSFIHRLFTSARGFTALYTRAAQLFRDLARARADGSLRILLARWARLNFLVVDDWAMAPLADAERRDFLGICEDRYQQHSIILTSQLPVAKWHELIGDPTLADSVLTRLVHNAHRIEMRGKSMR